MSGTDEREEETNEWKRWTGGRDEREGQTLIFSDRSITPKNPNLLYLLLRVDLHLSSFSPSISFFTHWEQNLLFTPILSSSMFIVFFSPENDDWEKWRDSEWKEREMKRQWVERREKWRKCEKEEKRTDVRGKKSKLVLTIISWFGQILNEHKTCLLLIATMINGDGSV